MMVAPAKRSAPRRLLAEPCSFTLLPLLLVVLVAASVLPKAEALHPARPRFWGSHSNTSSTSVSVTDERTLSDTPSITARSLSETPNTPSRTGTTSVSDSMTEDETGTQSVDSMSLSETASATDTVTVGSASVTMSESASGSGSEDITPSRTVTQGSHSGTFSPSDESSASKTVSGSRTVNSASETPSFSGTPSGSATVTKGSTTASVTATVTKFTESATATVSFSTTVTGPSVSTTATASVGTLSATSSASSTGSETISETGSESGTDEASDTLSLSDTASDEETLTRSWETKSSSETASTSETWSLSVGTRSLTDERTASASVTDSSSATNSGSVSISDSATVSDSAGSLTRSGATPTITRGSETSSMTQTNEATASVSDSVSSTETASSTASESETDDESASVSVSDTHSTTDSMSDPDTGSESVSDSETVTRASPTVTESESRETVTVSPTQTMPSPTRGTDSLTASMTASQSGTDSASSTVTMSLTDATDTNEETASVSGTESYSGMTRSGTPTVSFSNSLTFSSSVSVTATESISESSTDDLTDSKTGTLSVGTRTASDEETDSQTVSDTASTSESLSDERPSVSLTDSASPSRSWYSPTRTPPPTPSLSLSTRLTPSGEFDPDLIGGGGRHGTPSLSYSFSISPTTSRGVGAGSASPSEEHSTSFSPSPSQSSDPTASFPTLTGSFSWSWSSSEGGHPWMGGTVTLSATRGSATATGSPTRVTETLSDTDEDTLSKSESSSDELSATNSATLTASASSSGPSISDSASQSKSIGSPSPSRSRVTPSRSDSESPDATATGTRSDPTASGSPSQTTSPSGSASHSESPSVSEWSRTPSRSSSGTDERTASTSESATASVSESSTDDRTGTGSLSKSDPSKTVTGGTPSGTGTNEATASQTPTVSGASPTTSMSESVSLTAGSATISATVTLSRPSPSETNSAESTGSETMSPSGSHGSPTISASVTPSGSSTASDETTPTESLTPTKTGFSPTVTRGSVTPTTSGTSTTSVSPTETLLPTKSSSLSPSEERSRSSSATPSVSVSLTASDSLSATVSTSPTTSVSPSISLTTTGSFSVSASQSMSMTVSTTMSFGTATQSQTTSKTTSETSDVTASTSASLSQTNSLTAEFTGSLSRSTTGTPTVTMSHSGTPTQSGTATVSLSSTVSRSTTTSPSETESDESSQTASGSNEHTRSASLTVTTTITPPPTATKTNPTHTFTDSPSSTDEKTQTLSPSEVLSTSSTVSVSPTTTQPSPSQTVSGPSHTYSSSGPTQTQSPTGDRTLSSTHSTSPTVSVTVTRGTTSQTATTSGTPEETASDSTTSSESVTRTWGSPTASAEATATVSQTRTYSGSMSVSGTLTGTATRTITPPPTPSPTATTSSTDSASESSSAESTGSESLSPSDEQKSTTDTTSPTDSNERTESESESAGTVTPSQTISASPTNTVTHGTLTQTRSPSVTKSETTTVSHRTPTLSFSATISGSPSVSGTESRTVSDSLTSTKASDTPSASATPTSSASISDSGSETVSGETKTTSDSISPDSMSGSFTESMHVVFGDYVTIPYSPIDVLRTGAPTSLRFINSPPFRKGDRATLNPDGAPCPDNVAYRSIEMEFDRRRLIPSNWSFLVGKPGWYRVCYFSSAGTGLWRFVNGARALAFGVGHPVGAAPLVQDCGLERSIGVDVKGAVAGDSPRLIRKGSSCFSNAPSTFLTAEDVLPNRVNAVGDVPIAGEYVMCYRGFPTNISAPMSFPFTFRFVGVARTAWVNAPKVLKVSKRLNVTYVGAGFRFDDSFFLSETAGCTEAVEHIAGVTLRGRWQGAKRVTGLFRLRRPGVVYVCYRSNFSSERLPALLRLEVAPITASSVEPRGLTYAAGSDVELRFSGEFLDPRFDHAALHVVARGAPSTACVDPAPLRLSFNAVAGAWTARFPGPSEAPATYAVCYGTNTTIATPVGEDENGALLHVSPRFYEVEEAAMGRGLTMGDSLSLVIRGGLLDVASDAVWLAAASGSCDVGVDSRQTAVGVVGADGTMVARWANVNRRGIFAVCFATTRGALLRSIDTVAVLPAAPTSLSPNSGPAKVLSTVSLVGSFTGIDLASGDDRVGICTRDTFEITQVLQPVGAASFQFLPVAADYYPVCIEFGTKTHNGTVIQRVPIALFAVVPNVILLSAPDTTQVHANVVVVVDGDSLSEHDEMYVCQFGTTERVSAADVTTSRINKTAWEVSPVRPGRRSICYRLAGLVGRTVDVILLPSFIVDPTIDDLVPAAFYADDATVVSFKGIGTESVSAVYIDPQQRPCGSSVGDDVLNFTLSNSDAGVLANNSVFGNGSNISGDRFLARVPARGLYTVCFVGVSAKAYPASPQLRVLPRVDSMVLVNASTFFGGCSSEFVVSGAGISPSLDAAFLSRSPACQSIDARMIPLDPTSGSHRVVRYSAIPPQAHVEYTLCYARDGTSDSAVAYGALAAADSFSITSAAGSTVDGGPYSLAHRCVFFSSASFTYSVVLRVGGTPIPLDNALNTPTMAAIYHLPLVPFELVLSVQSPGVAANVSASTTVSLRTPTQYCTPFSTALSSPQTASPRKRFAEAFFLLLNFVNFNCAGVVGADPTPALEVARSLLSEDPSLLVDRESMLPVFSAAIPLTRNPLTQAELLLTATVPDLPPNVAAEDTQIDAHLAVVRVAMSVLQSAGGSSPAKTALVRKSLDRLNLVASAVCARGPGSTKVSQTTSSTLSILRSASASSAGVVPLPPSGSATVRMNTASDSGFCFAAASLPTSLLPNSETTVHRALQVEEVAREQQQQVASRDLQLFNTPAPPPDVGSASKAVEFNLPILSISVDVFAVPQGPAKIRSVELRYAVPAAVPRPTSAEPSATTAHLLLYRQNGNAGWVPEVPQSFAIDSARNELVVQVAPSTSSTSASSQTLLLSGRLWWTVAPTPPKKPEVDVALLVLTCVVGGVVVLAIGAARLRDGRLDAQAALAAATAMEAAAAAAAAEELNEEAEENADQEAEDGEELQNRRRRSVSVSRASAQQTRVVQSLWPVAKDHLLAHRYLACVSRAPGHPTTVVRRVAVVATFLFVALIVDVLFAASGEAPATRIAGVLGGLIVAVVATPIAVVVRVPLFGQRKDVPSVVAAVVAAAVGAGVIAGAGSSNARFAYGAVAVLCANVGVFAVAVAVFRGSWSPDAVSTPSVAFRLFGFALATATAAGAVAVGVVFAKEGRVPDAARTNLQVVSVFLWAVAADAFLLEPVKVLAVRLLQRAVLARFQGGFGGSSSGSDRRRDAWWRAAGWRYDDDSVVDEARAEGNDNNNNNNNNNRNFDAYEVDDFSDFEDIGEFEEDDEDDKLPVRYTGERNSNNVNNNNSINNGFYSAPRLSGAGHSATVVEIERAGSHDDGSSEARSASSWAPVKKLGAAEDEPPEEWDIDEIENETSASPRQPRHPLRRFHAGKASIASSSSSEGAARSVVLEPRAFASSVASPRSRAFDVDSDAFSEAASTRRPSTAAVSIDDEAFADNDRGRSEAGDHGSDWEAVGPPRRGGASTVGERHDKDDDTVFEVSRGSELL